MTTTTEHAAPGSRASAAHRPETPLTAVTTATATGAAVPLTPRECADRRRAELRAFLRARRARVSPAEAGIAPGSRRRTPGLRREEVAVLAGVGVSWYQWLEQGRDITVSPSVLDAVGRVLRLNAAELRHLYVLAGLNPPLEVEERQQAPDAGLLRIMRDWMPKPAHLCDRYWNLLAWNDAAGLLFGWNARGENCLVSFFTDPRFRVLYTEWEHLARHVVASYRAGMLPFLGDPEYDAVVERVAAASPEFVELWERHEAAPTGPLVKTIQHARLGRVSFESTTLRMAAYPDLLLTVHSPVDAAVDADLRRLVRAD